MDQTKAPLFEALRDRSRLGEASFHVPGHKFGALNGGIFQHTFGPTMAIDYTEIAGLDDLHHPEGVILQAQELAADCFGAEESFFLVGGSTAGNLCLLTTVCSRGDLILVQRNVHKSVLNGLMLAGARTVFLPPKIDPATGLASGVELDKLKEAIQRYPNAKGIFLSNPNYYGMGWDLADYVELVHNSGMPLLVDEAHGAHFGLHPEVPPSALSRGADGVVQSTHKMLTAMTMGAMLHVQGDRIDRDRLKRRLAMLQSSSPSYPLMASLDEARRLAAVSGNKLIHERLGWLRRFRQSVEELPFIRMVQTAKGMTNEAYHYIDPFKITLYDSTGRRTGFQLLDELGARGIVGEMADDHHVVLANSLATPQEYLERLTNALRDMEAELENVRSASIPVPAQSLIPDSLPIGSPVDMDIDMDLGTSAIWVPLHQAVGEIAAEAVIPYPPGIPLLFPGERIEEDAVKQILRLCEAGARFQNDLQQSGADCSILVRRKSADNPS